MKDDRDSYWFRAHRFGVGTAPHTWQGWLLTIVYAGAVGLAAHAMPGEAAKLAAIGAITAAFLALCFARTDWRREHDNHRKGKAMMGIFVKRAHLPWLIAIAAAVLTIGIALAVSA